MRYIIEESDSQRVPHVDSPQNNLLDDDVIGIKIGKKRELNNSEKMFKK